MYDGYKEERILWKTIKYRRNKVFPKVSGRKYVVSMLVEMVMFITDCWLVVA